MILGILIFWKEQVKIMHIWVIAIFIVIAGTIFSAVVKNPSHASCKAEIEDDDNGGE